MIPPFQGGQGRSRREVVETANHLAWLLLGGITLFAFLYAKWG